MKKLKRVFFAPSLMKNIVVFFAQTILAIKLVCYIIDDNEIIPNINSPIGVENTKVFTKNS